MKKRLQLVVVLLMFLALVGALASCQYRPIQEYTTTEAPSYEVVFVDLDGTTVKIEKVAPGEAATAPRLPDHDGYVFVGWDVDFSQVYSPLTVTAQYVKVWTVTFVDHNGSEINTFSVLDGEAAPTPVSPYRENHTFAGWDKDFTSVKGDMVIKATYVEDPKFTVEFLGFNGELLNTQKVYQGKNAILPTPPSVLHYTFKGWDQSTENVTANMTVNAIYEENAKFTVLFLDHLGNELKSEVVYIGEDATAPNAPEVDNYTFAGWDKAFANVQGDLTVSATYTENAKYTVQFVDYNGNVLHSEVVYVGKDATAPADPSRENHDFAGWDKAYTNIQGDLTVTAKYTEHAKFTVEFVDHDRKVLSSQVIYIGKDATAPADPSRENYDFAGWDKAFTNIQSDLTVNATYTEHEKFTVEFVDHDGRVLSSQVIYIGKDATAPADPSRENHDFAGWDKAYTNVQGNLTVTAKYTEHAKYTVTFVNYDGAVLKTETVYIGKDATAPADPTRENYFFAGWDKAYTNVQGDLTVTATYTEYQNFTVTFVDRNGNVLKTEVVRQGNAATAPEAPAVENHDFAGWDKAFNNVQSDLTVTAKYTEHAKYTVQFVGKDGTVLKTETVYVGKAATAPEAPAVENHDFAGWDKAFDNVQSDLTVTAKYTEHAKYTVQFLGKDGHVLKTETVYRGKGATAPEAPAVEGYTFKGWDIAFDAVTDDLTVRAIYEANEPVDPPVNPPESNVSYSVMHWTFGANTVYIGGYADKIVAAIEEANPDIVIMNGLSSAQFGKIAVPGYTCWAYGVNRDQDAASAGETSFRYLGGAMAVFFKTDKFTKAGDVFCPTEVGYSERYFSYVVFPLQDAQGNKIPVVSAGMSEGSDAKNPKFKTAELMASLKENLGSDVKNAVIRLFLTATQLDGSNLKDSLSVEGFVADQGTDIKKVAETVPASNFYAYMITSNASSVSAHAPVASTADGTTYPIYQGTNNAFITVAQTVSFNFAGIADTPAVEKHTVTFVGQDGTVLKTEEVEHGQAASAPEAPVVNGYEFTGWDVAFDNVQGDLTVNAIYAVKKYTVTFVGHDGAVLKTEEVEHGKAATAPEAPAVEGFEFKGWDIAFEAITDNLTVTAVYDAVSGGEDEEYEGTAIRTQEELAALANATAGVYTIITDLELVDWTSIALPAGVVLGGNNHTITGLTAPLFSDVYGTVKNLKIADANIVGTANTHKYGVVAIKMFDGAAVSHVDIINCNLAGYWAGGIAAEGEGNITIEYCTVSGSIKQASTSGNAFVGGMLGRYIQPSSAAAIAVCKIDHCVNEATITVTSGNASAGGIFGAYSQGKQKNEMYITNCVNNGKITASGNASNAAGIFAYGYRCGLVHILNCVNNEEISAANGTAGGIVAYLESGTGSSPTLPLVSDCVNNANITGKTNVGGIVGNAGNTGGEYGFRIHYCVNHGDVTASGANVGGIAGFTFQNYRTFHLIGSTNYGDVVGLDGVGGILGTYTSTSTTLKFEVAANYGNVTATNGHAGGLIGMGSSAGTNYTMNVTGFLQTGTVTGKVASAFIGMINVQKTTTTYKANSNSTSGNLYQEGAWTLTLKVNAAVLSGNVVGTDNATNFIGVFYGNSTPKLTLTNVLVDAQVTENGAIQENPVDYYSAKYVATAGDADLVGTENEGKTAYYASKKTTTLSYMVAYEPTTLVANDLELGAIVGGINASVETEGSAAYILNQASIALGETYPTWKNGATYPEIQLKATVKYTVTFVGKDGETLATVEVEQGAAATAPEAPAVEGYTFQGWDVAFDNVQGDLVVKAVYAVKKYTVTFIGHGGAELGSQEVEHGQAATAPEAPAVNGYDFTGWDVAFDNVQGDLTVNAIYTVKKYTVTFVGHDGAVLKTEEVEHGKAATAPEAPAVEGFEFKDWDIAFEAITDNLTITAVYEAVAGEEEYEGTPITTQEELAALANASAGVYTIISDLELVDWTSIALPAGVVLGGNNHTITGLTTALFSEVHGTVKNLKIADADIVGTTNSHKYGVLANKLFDGAVVSHVDIVNCNLVGYYAGGIAAEAEGNVTIEYCTVSGSIKQASTSGNALVGGILGRYLQPKNTVVCTIRIDHCTNNATISVSSNNASVGGIVGNDGQGMPKNEMYISNCINNGTVTSTGKNGTVGGILGYGYRCGLVHVEHCTNNAVITNEQGNAGGVVGYLESGSSGEIIIPLIYDCVNQGDVKGNNNVGGIIGTAGTTGSNDPFNIKECVNYGDVTGAGNKVGGIVGDLHENYKVFNLFGCSNHGTVTGLNEVGGIVGGYSNATVKFYVCANYGDVIAIDGAAGGFAGVGHSDKANTVTVNSFLQAGNVSGKVAGSLFGVVYSQQYTATYPGTKQYTATGKLYKETGVVTTINATACVLSGSVSATELAGELVGAVYSNSAPKLTLKDVISDVKVTEKGSVNSSPASYYQVAFVATAGDADLVGTENEGMTAYYGRAASAPSYMVAYEPNLSSAVANTVTLGEIVGGINASVETEGSAAYILNQAAIALGEDYPTWKNGATYPEIQLQVAEEEAPKFSVTFLGKDGETLATVEVEQGAAATAPEAPAVEGYTFQGWDVAFDNVQGDLVVKAIYAAVEVEKHTVTFIGHGGAELGSQEVEHGNAAVAPEAPAVEGYTFKGWDKAFDNVTEDMTVTAIYEEAAVVPSSSSTIKVIDLHTEKIAWNYTVSTFFGDVLPLLTDYDVIIISGARDAVLPEEYAADWGMQTVNYSRNTGGAAKAHIIIYRLSKFTLDTSCEALTVAAGDMGLTDGGMFAIPLVEKASNRQIVVAGMYWGTWDKTNNKTTCNKAFTPAMTALAQAFPNADATIISTQFITANYTCAGQGETISGLDGTAWVEGYDLKALSETDFVVSDVTYAHYVFTYAKDDALSISDNQVVAMPEQSTATGSVAFTATIQ